jgi:hypothetical protein
MNKYIKKQDVLNVAVDRVKARLTYYSQNSSNRYEDWNQWHDLQYRIENRLRENYSNYLSWHFNEYGFVAF